MRKNKQWIYRSLWLAVAASCVSFLHLQGYVEEANELDEIFSNVNKTDTNQHVAQLANSPLQPREGTTPQIRATSSNHNSRRQQPHQINPPSHYQTESKQEANDNSGVPKGLGGGHQVTKAATAPNEPIKQRQIIGEKSSTNITESNVTMDAQNSQKPGVPRDDKPLNITSPTGLDRISQIHTSQRHGTCSNCSEDIAFFGNNEGNRAHACWISLDEVTVMGCGHDGQVFNATMHCDGGSSRWVGLKVHTRVLKARRFKYSPETSLPSITNRYRPIYEAVMRNVTQGIKRRLLVPLGTVKLRPHVLVKHLNKANCRTLKTFFFHPPNNTDTVAVGTVVELGNGSPLNPATLTGDGHCRVARDLVCIYQHMFERNFVHQDISFTHFLYDENEGTSIYDFGRHDILKARGKDERARRAQLYQLMTLLGNVCLKSPNAFPVPNRVVKTSTLPKVDEHVIKNWTMALEGCEFKHTQQQQALQQLAINIPPASAYRLLSDWTGSCSDSEMNGVPRHNDPPNITSPTGLDKLTKNRSSQRNGTSSN